MTNSTGPLRTLIQNRGSGLQAAVRGRAARAVLRHDHVASTRVQVRKPVSDLNPCLCLCANHA